MVAAIVMTVMLIGMLSVLAYTLAIYALPFMLGLAAARFACDTGAGLIGAGLVGLLAGAASFGIVTLLCATVRAPMLRIAIAVIFAAPAAVAGHALVHSMVCELVPSPTWRAIFSTMARTRHQFLGAAAIGCRCIRPTRTKIVRTRSISVEAWFGRRPSGRALFAAWAGSRSPLRVFAFGDDR
jgi:hypothetical protein